MKRSKYWERPKLSRKVSIVGGRAKKAGRRVSHRSNMLTVGVYTRLR